MPRTKAPMTLLVQTVWRKVSRSIQEGGAWPTVQKSLAWPFRWAYSRSRELRPARRRSLREQSDFDRRHRVDTRRGRDPFGTARIESENWRFGRGYDPVPIEFVRRILGQLAIDFTQYVFIDLGTGKGLPLLLASEQPFAEIVGVEYSPRLAEIARKNLAKYVNPRQRCHALSVQLGDAAEFEFPTRPLVLFFHHPFDEPIFRRVLANLDRSLNIRPRPIQIVYYDAQCGYLFDANPLFQVASRGVSTDGEKIPWAVYELRAEQ